eukprot:TRINITY_DN383_c0_g1_i2.p1 TRINITY_DN383_c0_g1~~TRINITY_DN383_c0_g1_i2.p1  ORF type:complete len:979 (-),score=262.92 TRINITY_DN383_c0_g1_i2:24-2570(-)
MEQVAVKQARAEEKGEVFDESLETSDIDPRLTSIVEGMFDRCLAEKEYKQAMGMAIESMRLDVIERVVSESANEKEMLQYCYECCMQLLVNRSFKQRILKLLVALYKKVAIPDYMNMCRCLVFLDEASSISDLFISLLKEEVEDKTLLVFQIAFELVENATQKFRSQVNSCLPAATEDEGEFNSNLKKTHKILSGIPTVELQLEFLLRNNHTDLGVLNKIKGLFEPRISVLHTATIVSNSIMHCGTTKDTFLRENLEWLSKAVAWSKFTTTAGLGVIHKGHLSEAFNVLEPYLPKPGVEASPYTEGGSLCALGLIHANHGDAKTVDYLLEQLRNLDLTFLQQDHNPAPGSLEPEKKKEIVQHGAVLGLGLAAMGTGNETVFDELKHLCFTPKAAVAGEACGLAMGLIMLGTPTKAAEELLNFAHQTQHEKVIRSIGLGLGFTMFGLEEKADTMIESLVGDKDPVLRYGGQYTIGLAYCGTANNNAVRQLLHVAVSDVSDDVRRAAVTSLGFVMFRQPEQVPRLVALLSESYNPHVRYGAALALGIACAGTGMKEALALLDPLSKDSVPFVRQGAFIALAMVLVQVSEHAVPKVKAIRQQMMDVIGDKHQASMAKFGAVLALGIIDAGGRNQTISLSSPSGHTNLAGVVGLVIFLQYWYWYPFLNFISLSLSPTAVIGVNKNLEMPNYKVKSNARPSLYSVPAQVKAPKEVVLKALPTAQLSITKKQMLRESKKKKENQNDTEMEVEEKKEEVKEEEKEEKKETTSVEPEATFELLNNPARVTRSQLSVISYDVDPRYTPIITDVSGIVLLKDNKPGESEDILEPGKASTGMEVEEDEVEPPAPFEFLG